MEQTLANKINATITQGFPGVKNVRGEDNDDTCVLEFDFSNVHVSWELIKQKLFMKIRCDATVKDRTYDDLMDMVGEMEDRIGKLGVTTLVTDDVCTLQYLYSFADEANDETVARNIYNETFSFLRPLYDNLDIFTDEMSINMTDDAFFNYDAIRVNENIFEPQWYDEEAEESNPLDQMFDDLMKDIQSAAYDPKGYLDVCVEDDEINALLEDTDMDEEFSRLSSQLKDMEQTLDDASESMKGVINNIIDMNVVLYTREKDVNAKEKSLNAREQDFNAEKAELETFRDTILAQKAEMEEKQALIEAVEEKDREIEALKADLEQDGDTKQAYVRGLRKKVAYQEDYIKKVGVKLDSYAKTIMGLQMEVRHLSPDDTGLRASLEKANAENKTLEQEINALRAQKLENQGIERDELEKAIARADAEKAEKDSLAERFDALKEREQKIEEELAAAQEQLGKPDVLQVVNNLRVQAGNMGLNLVPIPGATNAIIGGVIGDCEASYDAENCVIFIQRELRKPKQAQSKIENMNNRDIRISCVVDSGGTLQCKAFCMDTKKVIRMIMDLTDEINSL